MPSANEDRATEDMLQDLDQRVIARVEDRGALSFGTMLVDELKPD